MIPVTTFAGKRAAVFGLGGSGMATAHALAAGGAEIVCYDDKRERVDLAWDQGLPTGDLRVADFSAFDALVLSPGVPLTHPAPHWAVEKARAAGIEIIGDIELLDRERRARLLGTNLVAITGTNGKSTVTALTGHLLRAMGRGVGVGGNIGRPALDLDPADALFVLEVSSYQIDLSPSLAPDVGVLLNVTPDHIDRHGTFENYRAIKERLVEASSVGVVGLGNAATADFARRLAGPRTVGFLAAPDAGAQALEDADCGSGVWASVGDGGWTFHAVSDGEPRSIGDLPDVPSLRGAHNAENAAAALAIVLALGLDPADAVPHLATFPGLPHRLEEVGRAGNVVFVNDSKATNAQSTWHALCAFERIHWIAGGLAKEGGITSLESLFPRVARAYLIGEAAPAFAKTLDGKVEARQYATLDRAVAEAADAARDEGGVVLLSPACASFDQFRSFEERGDTFRALVRARLEAA